jgi:hypothetical protein
MNMQLPRSFHKTRRLQRLRWASSMLVTLLLGTARTAWADAGSCAIAHESGQKAEQEGRLRKAVEQFTACAADDGCPDVIRKDCMALRDDATEALPTVTFAVSDGAHEVSNVRVFVDDELVMSRLDGLAVPLDPGRHRVKLMLPQGRVIASEVLLHEGQKNRLISVQTPKPPPAAASDAAPVEGQPSRRTSSPALWAVSGVGVSALALGTTFALFGRAEERAVVDCAPRCTPAMRSNLDRARRDYLVANIGFGVAGAAAATAIVLYLATPTQTTKPPPVVSSLRLRQVSVVPANGGWRASAGFSFRAL